MVEHGGGTARNGRQVCLARSRTYGLRLHAIMNVARQTIRGIGHFVVISATDGGKPWEVSASRFSPSERIAIRGWRTFARVSRSIGRLELSLFSARIAAHLTDPPSTISPIHNEPRIMLTVPSTIEPHTNACRRKTETTLPQPNA